MDDFFLFLSDLFDLVTSPKKERTRLVVIAVTLTGLTIAAIAAKFYFFP